MITLIIIFGLLTALAGVVIVINPETIFGYLKKNVHKSSVHFLAVVLRLVLGILLIQYADVSRFPLAIQILGWLSIAAAVALAAIGRRGFQALMAWAFGMINRYGHIAGLVALAIGAFLVYAFV